MSPRLKMAEAEETATELAPAPVTIERGARLMLTATVLRVNGPWVDISVLGELQHVLRSKLEKELSNDGR